MFKRKKQNNEENIEIYQINDFYDDQNYEYENYDNNTNNDLNCTEENNPFEITSKKQKTKKNSMKNLIIVIGIVIYVCFVGLGAVLTTYTNDKQPQIINVRLREERRNYKLASKSYNQIKDIIDSLNELDNSLANADVTQSFSYATEYKKYIDIVSNLYTEIKNDSYSDECQFLQEIAIAVCNNLSAYITAMSNGMSSQSSDYLEKAQTYKQKYTVQFKKYSDNMAQFKLRVQIED